MAGQGGHGNRARRTLLGSRARTSGLSGAIPERLYLPLSETGLGAAEADGGGLRFLGSNRGSHPYSPSPRSIKKPAKKRRAFFIAGGEGGMTARLRRWPFGSAGRKAGLVISRTLGSNRGSHPWSPSPRSIKKPAKKEAGIF